VRMSGWQALRLLWAGGRVRGAAPARCRCGHATSASSSSSWLAGTGLAQGQELCQ
jgi:hypothetical protein